MRIISILLLLILAYYSQAQNSVVFLDGSNDYIYSDFNAANDARTFELWFKPNIDYDSSLSHFATLISRDPGIGMPNNDVFTIAFQHNSIQPGGGFLNFTYSVTSYEYYSVLSDDNNWDADRWYHVAGVIHPNSGMMLFIDGKKQEMVTQYYNATGISDLALCIGHWGYPPTTNDRYFNGSIDDIRISSIARYSEDFTPPCPDLQTDEYTKALWNLNEGNSNILADSSGHEHYAFKVGGMWYDDDPCATVDVEQPSGQVNIKNTRIYPIPADEFLIVELGDELSSNVCLYNITGIKVLEREIDGNKKYYKIQVNDLPSGNYILEILSEERVETKKIIINH